MSRKFVLPDLGEGVKEGQVLRLMVAEGDQVAEDQILMEVETDKAAVEIPSPYTGRIARWHVSEQEVVNVGDTMVTFAEVDGATRLSAADDPPGSSSLSTTPATTPGASSLSTNPATPPGSPSLPVASTTPPPREMPAAKAGASRKPASPAVRKLARELGVDIEGVEGSGPGGRVQRSDVERAAGAASARDVRVAEPRAPAAAIVEPPGAEGTDACGRVRREPISKVRRATADAMSHSMATIPHVTDTDDADVTDLDRLRHGYNEGAPAERRIGILPFVIRAAVRALQAHPVFNASFDKAGGAIVYKRYYNLAIGIHTDRGLVAPILRDADRMSIPQIQDALNALIEKARAGTFSLDETRGATYTISNAGAMGGSRYSTPIITPPQVAVLALGRTRLQPWVVDGELQPRLIMPLSHSMDHRIIDGGIEIPFIRQLVADLENPARLMM